MGILNLKSGYVFIHIPKCAGVSISSLLLQSRDSKEFMHVPELDRVMREENLRSSEKVESVAHARARDVRACVGDEMYEKLESFAVLRNPWERLRSRYFYERKVLAKALPNHLKGSLDDYAAWACENRPSTMHERVTDRSGNIIVKHLLKQENLDAEFSAFAKSRLGIKDDLPVMNTSENKNNRAAFSPENVKRIRSVYKKDFAMFGYSDSDDASEGTLSKSAAF